MSALACIRIDPEPGFLQPRCLLMPESLFFLSAAVLMLMFGGMMFWDILSAYGVSSGPDAFASRHRFFAWPMKLARVDQDPTTSSKWVMWWRLITTVGVGVLLLSFGIVEAFGSR